MTLRLLSLLLFLQTSTAFIFYLNKTEYARMPPVFHLDRYETCLHADNDTGVYCSAKFALVTDQPSQLYDMIRNYSAKTESHYNHTELFYGICLTKTCKHLYEQNTTQDQTVTLEACLNNSLWEDYKLKARIIKSTCENGVEDSINLDASDIAVATVILVVLMLNIVGTFQDICNKTKSCQTGNNVFSCFSIHRNWKKLTAPVEGQDPRLERLKGFHGIRALTMMIVLLVHSLFYVMTAADNTHYLEEMYKKWNHQLVINGLIFVQTFFLMSGFFLAYNMQLHSEKKKNTWLMILNVVIKRYIRLTVPFALVLAFTATWVRYLGKGPFWQSLAMTEVEECRQNWWINLLYLMNYHDNSRCKVNSWYLAADFQLYVVGVLICALTAGRWRKSVLMLLFLIGVAAPAYHVYFQDLDGTLILSPEFYRNIRADNKTFDRLYKPAHTNIVSFVIGLAIGQLVFHWQTTACKFQLDAKRRCMVWLSFPTIMALSLLDMVFYLETPRVSVYFRMLYAALVKPAFSGVLSVLIVGMVFKFEDMYRGFLEWRGWLVISRLSYSMYIVLTLTTMSAAIATALLHISLIHLGEVFFSTFILSFIAAIPLHLLVEAPTLRLLKLYSENSGQGSADYTVNSKTNGSFNKKEDLIINILAKSKDSGKKVEINNSQIGEITNLLKKNGDVGDKPNKIQFVEPEGAVEPESNGIGTVDNRGLSDEKQTGTVGDNKHLEETQINGLT